MLQDLRLCLKCVHFTCTCTPALYTTALCYVHVFLHMYMSYATLFFYMGDVSVPLFVWVGIASLPSYLYSLAIVCYAHVHVMYICDQNSTVEPDNLCIHVCKYAYDKGGNTGSYNNWSHCESRKIRTQLGIEPRTF